MFLNQIKVLSFLSTFTCHIRSAFEFLDSTSIIKTFLYELNLIISFSEQNATLTKLK